MPTIRKGEPYPCPECGAAAWLACYLEEAQQAVRLVAGAEGEPIVDDYLGDTRHIDNGVTDDECFICEECQYNLVAPAAGNTNPRVLLQRIADELSGKEWSPDTLDSIANILRGVGFEIADPASGI